MINSNNKKCIKTGFVLHILSTNMITNVDLFCDEKGNAYVNDNAKIRYKRIYDCTQLYKLSKTDKLFCVK
jgi:hypothetical protein